MQMTGISATSVSSLDSLIEGCTRAVVTAHEHPDGDAVGSTFAMMRYLRDVRGVDATVVLADEIPESLKFIVPEEDREHVLSGKDSINSGILEIASADLVVLMDANGFSRTGAIAGALGESTARKVLVDHHVGPESGDFDIVFSTSETSSTSELLYWLLMEMPETSGDAALLPPAAAFAMMAGMTTDTNNFANSVFPSTLEMASALIGAGVDREYLLEMLYNRYRENRLRAMGWLLGENMHITPEGAAVMILRQEDIARFDIREGETDGFVNLPLAVENVRMSVFIKEEDGLFRVSIRSKRGTSARELASAHFHGGGHENAAGGKVFPGDIPSGGDLETYLYNILKEFLI